MTDNYYQKYAKAIDGAFFKAVFTDAEKTELSHDEGLSKWCEITKRINEVDGM
ncbi:MAG: hypothetical protein JKY51_09520, partial [Opitutaceae bacterium]|nr:hypothetical protein [Opitutaceae bacterium]